MFTNTPIATFLVGCAAVLLAACGGGDENPPTTDETSATSTVEPEVPAEPIRLTEAPPEQFCNAGWIFAEARDAGFGFFEVPADEVQLGPFADLYTAQTVMLGWGPEATELDLELIGSGLVALEKVFADHGYDPEAVRSTSDAEEQLVLQRFDAGDVSRSVDRILAAWESGCLEELGDDSTPAVTTTVPSLVDRDPFCDSDDAILDAMEVLAGADELSHEDFLAANTTFFEALAAWTPADAVQLQAFDLRQIWIEVGGTYAATGDQAATADAFQAVQDDPHWIELRGSVDAWRDGRC